MTLKNRVYHRSNLLQLGFVLHCRTNISFLYVNSIQRTGSSQVKIKELDFKYFHQLNFTSIRNYDLVLSLGELKKIMEGIVCNEIAKCGYIFWQNEHYWHHRIQQKTLHFFIVFYAFLLNILWTINENGWVTGQCLFIVYNMILRSNKLGICLRSFYIKMIPFIIFYTELLKT